MKEIGELGPENILEQVPQEVWFPFFKPRGRDPPLRRDLYHLLLLDERVDVFRVLCRCMPVSPG